MDPRCFTHWPWNQQPEAVSARDLAHSEIYHKFFTETKSVIIEVPPCMDGFVWTGIRFVTREPDMLHWYPLGIVVPLKEAPLLHTIFIHYGSWNILPIAFTPEYVAEAGKPILKIEFTEPVSGKIELLAQKLA
jgi:hypothetical protein